MLVNEAGETVASAGWDNLEGDAAMFGGFVSAIQMFVQKAAGGSQVRELRFGDMKLLIGNLNGYYVVTLHEAEQADAEKENQEVVSLVDHNNGTFNDGILDFIQEIVKSGPAESKVEASVREWTESQLDKLKKSASDWGKTVF